MIMCHALQTPAVSKLSASGPRASEVSIAIDLDSRAYFSFFPASAAVATAVASLVASSLRRSNNYVL